MNAKTRVRGFLRSCGFRNRPIGSILKTVVTFGEGGGNLLGIPPEIPYRGGRAEDDADETKGEMAEIQGFETALSKEVIQVTYL